MKKKIHFCSKKFTYLDPLRPAAGNIFFIRFFFKFSANSADVFEPNSINHSTKNPRRDSNVGRSLLLSDSEGLLKVL